jgi:hypothetical protein
VKKSKPEQGLQPEQWLVFSRISLLDGPASCQPKARGCNFKPSTNRSSAAKIEMIVATTSNSIKLKLQSASGFARKRDEQAPL